MPVLSLPAKIKPESRVRQDICPTWEIVVA
jgi:hypothetical protein